MARRHPEGRDAEYLRWHTLDHRPEQHRIAGVRASLRLVSTPACRAARAYSDERFDATLLPTGEQYHGVKEWDVRTYSPAVVGIWQKKV
jgi:hypothetical protein